MIYRTEFVLPGVFTANAWPNAINGSLWTLRWEVYSYGLLLLAWLLSQTMGRSHRTVFKWLIVLILTCAFGALLRGLGDTEFERLPNYGRLFTFFFLGSLLYLFRRWVPLSPYLGILAGIVLIASFQAPHWLFGLTYTLCLPYLVVSLAYLRSPSLASYNRMGDYSYGIYIYAFPIQQLVALLWPASSVGFLMAVSMALTVTLAVLSWHLVEKPCLNWEKARQRAALTPSPRVA